MQQPDVSSAAVGTQAQAQAQAQDETVVLIVDDVPTNIQILADILKQDYRVLFATSGEQALSIAATREPDLILLDVMMPGIDGFMVCTRLKKDPLLRDTPVIFVTAMGEVEDETRGFEVGAVDYITKPVSPPVVRARVRNHLELKHQRDLLRRIALVDGLTGIANRRQFDESLDREWRRTQRQDAPLSLIMADIDYFKGYNDHYGHGDGDTALRAVAQTLKAQMLRPTDVAARYGGEEFVCILPETPLAGAEGVAERIRYAVEALAILHAASPDGPYLTLSLGVATAVEPTSASREALLALADQALYEAKKAGRNRVHSKTLASSEPPEANEEIS
jgi:diguanylate cyclase (GGDEF)-like protein